MQATSSPKLNYTKAKVNVADEVEASKKS